MKITELIERLQTIERENGDFDVTVQAMGGLAGSTVPVTKASSGIDWSRDQCVLDVGRPLMIQTEKHKELRRARARIANAMMRYLKHGGDWANDKDFLEGTEILLRLEDWKWGKRKP